MKPSAQISKLAFESAKRDVVSAGATGINVESLARLRVQNEPTQYLLAGVIDYLDLKATIKEGEEA